MGLYDAVSDLDYFEEYEWRRRPLTVSCMDCLTPVDVDGPKQGPDTRCPACWDEWKRQRDLSASLRRTA